MQPASFAEMQAPLPRERFGFDTQFPSAPALEAGPRTPIDVRDPRTRSFGHIDAESMDPALQTQDRLAVSASMRTALLVYSGITREDDGRLRPRAPTCPRCSWCSTSRAGSPARTTTRWKRPT